MRILEIQERLVQLAKELQKGRISVNDRNRIAGEIVKLSSELSRRRGVRRAPNYSTPMTESLRRMIVSIHTQDRRIPFSVIAAKLNINSARVSETLRGFRT